MINVVTVKVRPPETLPDGVRNHGYVYERDTFWHEGCFSMSGFTRDVLGEPG